MDFTCIPGTTGKYITSAELVISGNIASITEAKKRLTIVNLAAQKELAQLKKTVHRNVRHLYAMKKRHAELLETVETKCFAEREDGSLSIPPGFWFLCESVAGHESTVQPVALGGERYYQVEIVKEALKYKRSSIVAATGSGKSIIIRNLTLSLVKAGMRVVVVVPSIELLTQTFKTIKAGCDQFDIDCGMLGGGKKPKDGVTVLVTTAQSALNYIDRFQAVICDEAHLVAAATYQDLAIATINSMHFHSLTATIERPDGLTPLIHAWAGKVVYSYSYKQAVSDGFLAPVKYYQKEVKSNAQVRPNTHMTKEYIAVHSDPHFIGELATMVKSSLAKGRPTLVLFKASECCNKLAKALGVEAASGEYRKPFYDFRDGKTELLIGNTALLGVGIDAPRISTIIYVASGVSEITFMQAVGRGTRIAAGKADCVVVDVVPNNRKFINMAGARMQIAKRAGFCLQSDKPKEAEQKSTE